MHSAQKRLGVEVFVPGDTDGDVPCCPHGPMLMFERYFESKPSRKFYSCSACRDRKDCSFFQWVDEKISSTCSEAHKKIIAASKPPFDSSQCWKRLQIIQGLSEMERTYCHSCSQLLLPKERPKHKNHEISFGIMDKILASPSHLLKPLEKKKYFAENTVPLGSFGKTSLLHRKIQQFQPTTLFKCQQYLFSDVAVDFFLETFKKLGFKNVLCVGAPRIHEAIQTKFGRDSQEMDSLLLDLDHRYGQFNDDAHFIHYNMFNHHFFEEESAEQLIENFFKKSTRESTVVVMDPPFGGLVQVLASSLRKIWTLANANIKSGEQKPKVTELPTFWIFPYFMESHILEELPSFTMCDYKVDYDNHPLYRKHHGQNAKASPVRIFTNISGERIVLPEDEGYRYCEQCKRYVTESNVHCDICNNCTSKDGRVWVHCEQCNKCVKQGRLHCQPCDQCCLPNHVCDRTSRGCHVCGEMDHKRKNCPERSGQENKQKRKKNKTKFSRKRMKTSKE